MDWGTIVVALVSLLGTIIGSYSGMKLMSYRIEQLEKKVERLASFAEEIPVLKETIRILQKRMDDLEDWKNKMVD